ncbi:MAG: ATP-dependent zinc metalloprotease FtsH [Candidatus Omnitrophica bacterium]|nr:ATP-dependent zinc metalloprotease FtsH [Candidatus Omnitrophota bacterium]
MADKLKKNSYNNHGAGGRKRQPGKNEDPEKKRLMALLMIPVLFFLVLQLFVFPNLDVKRMSYSEFYQLIERNPETQEIVSCELVESTVHGKLRSGAYFQVNIPPNDLEIVPLLRRNVPNFDVNPPQMFWRNLVYSVLPVLLLIAFFWFFVYRGVQQGGGKIFSFGKSRAKLSVKEKSPVTFRDVAGVEEAKEELEEIIEFLKDPQRFQKLGGRIPKGVLLMGPPGTGKTLLAKAVAGEADVPFFSISGSDFVEMFVGVGAARVRDLFEQGKRAAKASGKGAILFIDEIDAVGRQRFAGIGGGHDEREQTLNALLVEMDGFDTHSGVILIGSTNRPDVLDPALLRPGRFDRQVVIERPDIKGREEILKVHVRNIKLDKDINLSKISRQTPGFSGADLANLVNEAALLGARRGKSAVSQQELEESIEKVMVGPERKSRVISKKEKEIKAVHESGHALIALLLPNADPVHKISIIPRGYGIGGYTLQMPTEDKNLISRQELLDRITVLLGGRVAEEIRFQEVTSGAQDDLEKATHYAQMMVCELGMSEKLGHLTFGKKDRQVFLGRDLMREKDYSEQTAIMIDEEVRNIVDSCFRRAHDLVAGHKDELLKLSDRLLEKEVLEAEEIRSVIGGNGNTSASEGHQS